LWGGVFLLSFLHLDSAIATTNTASVQIKVVPATRSVGGARIPKNFGSWYMICDGVKWQTQQCRDWGSHGSTCTNTCFAAKQNYNNCVSAKGSHCNNNDCESLCGLGCRKKCANNSVGKQ